MKKFLLTFLCAFFCLFSMAQSEKIYTEPLVVTINGESTEPQDASVTVVDNGDGTINFVLKNFMLGAGEDAIPVGNIRIDNLATEAGEDGLLHFTYNDDLEIQPGDMEDVSEEDWLGPMLGSLPLRLQGKMSDDKLYVTIDIDLMETPLQQIVYVQLGTDDFNTTEPISKVYTEPLVVTINGESTEPQDASVTVVDNGDGTINFVLKNFMLGAGEDAIPVGNIRIDNLATEAGEDGLLHFTYNDDLEIQPGDMEGVSEEDWLGPMLGSLPLRLQGKMSDDKLYVTIDIDLMGTPLQQIVYVQLGTDDFNAAKVGDVNADGDVTIADGVAVLNAMAGQEVPGNADVNNDGEITIADFVAVLNLMAGQ